MSDSACHAHHVEQSGEGVVTGLSARGTNNYSQPIPIAQW